MILLNAIRSSASSLASALLAEYQLSVSAIRLDYHGSRFRDQHVIRIRGLVGICGGGQREIVIRKMFAWACISEKSIHTPEKRSGRNEFPKDKQDDGSQSLAEGPMEAHPMEGMITPLCKWRNRGGGLRSCCSGLSAIHESFVKELTDRPKEAQVTKCIYPAFVVIVGSGTAIAAVDFESEVTSNAF
jgi:hypothetical protein